MNILDQFEAKITVAKTKVRIIDYIKDVLEDADEQEYYNNTIYRELVNSCTTAARYIKDKNYHKAALTLAHGQSFQQYKDMFYEYAEILEGE